MSYPTPAAVSAAHALLRLTTLVQLAPSLAEERGRAGAESVAALRALGPAYHAQVLALVDAINAATRRASLAAAHRRGIA